MHDLWAWLRPRPKTLQERIREQRTIDALAAQFEGEQTAPPLADSNLLRR
jgi:hypothetical protein